MILSFFQGQKGNVVTLTDLHEWHGQFLRGRSHAPSSTYALFAKSKASVDVRLSSAFLYKMLFLDSLFHSCQRVLKLQTGLVIISL